ncbi:hypothetical protein BC830DRAFT_1100654 [Chytriomyces sp. MP71]|nr:hypothetical protein BC830DRAFT_1100654 [Chytriomyces sp. MP71]
MSDKPKSMRLSFKGDPKTRKKKRASSERDAEGTGADGSEPLEGWTTADAIDHLMGPIMLLTSASANPACIVSNDKSYALALQSLGDARIDAAEPVHVGQVFLVSRLPTGEARVSIKSAFDRYMSCDKFGVVSCDKEAVGPYEEWEVVKREDGFALQSVTKNGFLSCEPDGVLDSDEDPEKLKRAATGKSGYGLGGGRICGTVRADADSVGFKEVFQLRCQRQNLANAQKKKKKEKEDADALAMDADQLKRSQSYGRVDMTEREAKLLKKAQKQGNLNEALLERREKIKADRYCK